MTFSNLSGNEKDAFFSLLDEYFTSRPGLLSGNGSPPHSSEVNTRNAQAAVSVAQQAIASNPQLASRMVSTGLRNFGVSKSSPSPSPSPAAETEESESTSFSVKSRIAAASQLFNQTQAQAPPRPGPKPGASGLVASKKFGDVSTSSARDFFGSLKNGTQNKAPVAPPAPPASNAFAPKKNNFAPPPVRRMTTQDEPSESAASPPPPPPPPPPPMPTRVLEKQGEWAEALYDYESAESGDLNIQENQRILVTDRSDDDWWKGEVDGRSGLFPASYVKIL